MDTDVQDKQDEYRCQGWTGWTQTSGVDRLGRIQTSGTNRMDTYRHRGWTGDTDVEVGRIQTSGMDRLDTDVRMDRP